MRVTIAYDYFVLRFAVLACAGCAFHNGASVDAGGDTPPAAGHARQIDITDSQVAGGPHASFPLLVSLSAPWLKSAANGGDVARDDGFDIQFTLFPGATPLDHEIETYAPATGDLVAWVRIPALSRSSVLYIHYGDSSVTASTANPAGVWAGYAGVWHLQDDRDSTGKNADAMESGTVATTGEIGGARQFPAAGDYIDAGAGAAIADAFAAGGTVEAWIRPSSWGGNSVARIIDKQAPVGWVFEIEGPGGDLAFYQTASGGNGYWNCPAGLVVLDEPRYVAASYDKSAPATSPAFFVDGALVSTNPTTFMPMGTLDSDAASSARIGNNSNGTRTWDGWIDEVRLSAVVRSPDWIATSYQNQSNPAGFYTVGPEL
jgi:hypothetical protein